MPDAATATLAEPLLPADAARLPPSPARDRTADASPSPRGRGDGGGGVGSAAGVAGPPPADAVKAGSAPAGAGAAPPAQAAADDDDDGSGGAFDCNVCYDVAREPVVTLCGHLYCWPCLYRWMQVQSHCRACPVCKAGIDEDRVIPIYGRGGDQADPRKDGPATAPPAGKGGEDAAAAAPAAEAAGPVPRRPPGQHTPAAPAAPAAPPMPHLQPGLGLIPTLFGLGPAAGVAGAGYVGPGAGGAGPGGGAPGLDLTPEQQHQAFLSRLLLMLGSFVIMCLLLF